MRDVIFALIIFGSLPVCFRRPLIGLLMFSWLAYMRTQDLTWGFARHQRWSFLVAAVMGAGFFAQPRKHLFEKDPRCWAMIALAIWFGLAVVFADGGNDYSIERMFKRYVEFVKIIGIGLFTTVVVNKKEHLRVLVWVIALSFGFYGIKVGLAGVLSLGRVQVLQGPGGMLEDNNDFSLALCMALPLLIHIGATEQDKHLRRGIWLAAPLTAFTVIMTTSRGGFLALSAVIFMLVWRSRNRVAAFSVGGVALLIGLMFIPPKYYDRLTTLTSKESIEADGSAMGRIAAWKTGVAMATNNPLVGVGMNQFQANYNQYKTTNAEAARVAHNAYIQVWAECGTPALLLYLFLIFSTLWRLRRLRKDALQTYNSSWIISYAAMFEVSMIAFVVGSTFLNRATFDLFYHFVAITVAFEAIARREMAELRKIGLAPRRGGGSQASVGLARGFGRVGERRGFRPAVS
jgi:probable O-glycosylation ligase (exosortase A-associated)